MLLIALFFSSNLLPVSPLGGDVGYWFGEYRDTVSELGDPAGVVIGDDGRIFVAEGAGGTVCIADAGGGVISRWNGGQNPMLAPQGIALDGQRILVSDRGLHQIRVFDQNGKPLATWGGLGSKDGLFNRPAGLAVSGDRVVVADRGNDRVQIFDSSGTFIRTIDGKEGEGGAFSRPMDVALDSQGNLYVADTDHNRIRKFTMEGRQLSQWGDWGAFPGLFDEPVALSWFQDRLWVVDRRNHRVQTFDSNGKLQAIWGTHELLPHEGGGKLHYPNGLAVAPDGSFAVLSEAIEDRCQVFDPHPDGMEMGEPPQVNKNRTHYGDHLSVDGTLLTMVEPENHYVFVYDIRREVPIIVNKFGERGSGFGLMIRTTGLDLDLDSKTIATTDLVTGRFQVFQVDYNPGEALKFSPQMTRFANSIDFEVLGSRIKKGRSWPLEPTALKRDQKGFHYLVDPRNDRIFVYDRDMAFARQWGGSGTAKGRFRQPTDLAFSRNGKTVYVVDALNKRVQAFNRKGRHKFTFGGSGDRPGSLGQPFGICAGKDGFVYVSDQAYHRIVKFDERGRFVTQWGQRGADMGQFWNPAGLAMDDQLRLFVVDQGNHRAQIFSADGTWKVTFGAGRAYTSRNRPKKP